MRSLVKAAAASGCGRPSHGRRNGGFVRPESGSKGRRSVRRRRVAHLLAISAVGGVLSGCSFGLVRGPPGGHQEMRGFGCTSSYVMPVLDVLGLGLGAAVTARQILNEDVQDPRARDWAVLSVGVGSAIYGFTQAARCRSAQSELRRRLNAGSPPGA